MSKMNIKHLVILTFGLLAGIMVASCSIREDRSVVPCIVKLNVAALKDSLPEAMRYCTLELSVFDNRHNRVYYDAVPLDDVYKVREISVPRGYLDFTAVVTASYDDHTRTDTTILGSIGTQADPIYAEIIPINTECEELEVSLALRKQYSVITVNTSSERPTNELVLEARGNYNGLGLTSLKAVKHPFMCTSIPQWPDYRTWTLLIPRQAGTDLTLEVMDGRDMAHVTEVPLGDWLVEAGYDFAAKELGDYTVTLDVYAGTAKISASDWDEESITMKY